MSYIRQSGRGGGERVFGGLRGNVHMGRDLSPVFKVFNYYYGISLKLSLVSNDVR